MTKKSKSFKEKILEYIKFNIVGISNFWVSQLFYLTLYLGFKVDYIIAYTITSFLSVTASYFINSKFTFKNERYSLKKLLLTILVYVVEFALNMTIIIFLVSRFNVSEMIAPIIAPVFSTLPVFFTMRFIIKKNTI